MSYYPGLNFFLVLLSLVILLPVISPLSITKYVYAISDQSKESINNKSNNGKGTTRVMTLMIDQMNRTKMDLMIGDVNTILSNNNSA